MLSPKTHISNRSSSSYSWFDIFFTFYVYMQSTYLYIANNFAVILTWCVQRAHHHRLLLTSPTLISIFFALSAILPFKITVHTHTRAHWRTHTTNPKLSNDRNKQFQFLGKFPRFDQMLCKHNRFRLIYFIYMLFHLLNRYVRYDAHYLHHETQINKNK